MIGKNEFYRKTHFLVYIFQSESISKVGYLQRYQVERDTDGKKDE